MQTASGGVFTPCRIECLLIRGCFIDYLVKDLCNYIHLSTLKLAVVDMF